MALLCVVLLHIGLVWLLDDASTSRPRAARVPVGAPPVAIRVLPPSMLPAASPSADARTGGGKAMPGVHTATPKPRQVRYTVEPCLPIEPPALGPTEAPSAPAIPADTAPHPSDGAASASGTTAAWLDSDATRRAIRASSRATSLAERTAAASGEPARVPQQGRMAAAVAGTAKGDCATGAYLGAGMGLLSLPFLAAAALHEQCTPH